MTLIWSLSVSWKHKRPRDLSSRRDRDVLGSASPRTPFRWWADRSGVFRHDRQPVGAAGLEATGAGVGSDRGGDATVLQTATTTAVLPGGRTTCRPTPCIGANQVCAEVLCPTRVLQGSLPICVSRCHTPTSTTPRIDGSRPSRRTDQGPQPLGERLVGHALVGPMRPEPRHAGWQAATVEV